MVHLMIKDLLIQKKSFLVILLLSFFMFVVFGNETFHGAIYVMGGWGTTYIFLMTANTNDEKNNSDILLNSLPVLRKTIVKAKYLTVFVYMAIGLTALTLLGFILSILPLPIPVPRFIIGTDILFTTALIAIATAIYYPIYFKFGASATRIFAVFFFMGFFFFPRIFMEQYQSGKLTMIAEAIARMSSISTWIPGLLATLLLLIMFIASMQLSQRVYSRKDL